MTVAVDTPQGLRSGSSIREISSQLQDLPGKGGPTPLTEFKGEAVAVDLPGGRTLFALLDESINITSIFEPNDSTPELFVANVAKLGRPDQRGRTVVLSPDNYPRLVTFRGIRDPTSVREVDPADLAASFGPGMRLRRITLETTGDDISAGIRKRLKWLSKYPEPRLDSSYRGSTSPNLAEQLAHGDFFRREAQ